MAGTRLHGTCIDQDYTKRGRHASPSFPRNPLIRFKFSLILEGPCVWACHQAVLSPATDKLPWWPRNRALPAGEEPVPLVDRAVSHVLISTATAHWLRRDDVSDPSKCKVQGSSRVSDVSCSVLEPAFCPSAPTDCRCSCSNMHPGRQHVAACSQQEHGARHEPA
jgi:hypothetical protein